jgi:hypothetical protein
MKTILLSTLCTFFLIPCFTQQIPKDSLYFGQTPPGETAVVFAPGKITLSGRQEHAGVFNVNGDEFYFTSDNSVTYVLKYADNKWSAKSLATFSSISGGAAEICIYKQDSCVIFASRNGITSDGWIKTDFWFAKRKGSDWDSPKKLNALIDNMEVQWHPSISDSGRIFFGSRGVVYEAVQINDTTYTEPIKLNDNNINLSGTANADPFIAPDESYLIFSSNRPGGYGANDLYITFKKADNTWTNPKNLGNKINSTLFEVSPHTTPDGKYLIFSKYVSGGDNTEDLYWVSTSFIDRLNPTGILHPFIQTKNIQIYPNPTKEKINISFGTISYGNAIVEITNMDGKQIYLNTFRDIAISTIDLTGNQKGIFLIKLIIDGEIIIKKICLN